MRLSAELETSICARRTMWLLWGWAFFCSVSVWRATLDSSTAVILLILPGFGRPDEKHLPFAERLQLPDVGWRRAGLQCGDVDAARRPGLACTHPAYPPQCDRGRCGHVAAVRTASALAAADRLCRRPSRPAKAALRHTGGDGRAGPGTGYPHHRRARPVMAGVRVCVSAWLRRRV